MSHVSFTSRETIMIKSRSKDFGTLSVMRDEAILLEHTIRKVLCLASGDAHTAVVCGKGTVYTLGEGKYGRLGHGNEESLSKPKSISQLFFERAKGVACGSRHTIILLEDGNVYSFGKGDYGQLGHGEKKNELNPKLVEALEGKLVKQVACGKGLSMALTSNSRLYTWGKGDDGRLGHGTSASSSNPCLLESLLGHNIVSISTSGEHCVAIVDSKQSHVKKMKAMIDNESCSDVSFLLDDGDRIYASKSILTGQSEYFEAMFRSGMRESKENEIRVEGCSKKVLLLFLQYIYTSDVGACEIEDAMLLCVLADRYQETFLCRRCLDMVEHGLTSENAISSLAESETLGFDGLINVCKRYFICNRFSLKNREDLNFLSHSMLVEVLGDVLWKRNSLLS